LVSPPDISVKPDKFLLFIQAYNPLKKPKLEIETPELSVVQFHNNNFRTIREDLFDSQLDQQSCNDPQNIPTADAERLFFTLSLSFH